MLHIAHTGNRKARENLAIASTMLLCNTFVLLTGPHTFIASSFKCSSHLAAQYSSERDESVSS
ncbi:hypothetical protein SynA15127_02533 [Synechococcus sp. A15-127]|nr:hypothetical protein SynA15127_00545 [Synechococcus sp. A15-127]QNI95591.1 hypothetical protein SynA15127_02533 [Synechococcus sp. A15-127]